MCKNEEYGTDINVGTIKEELNWREIMKEFFGNISLAARVGFAVKATDKESAEW